MDRKQKATLRDLEKQKKEAEQSLAAINQEIEEIQAKEIEITDHAIVRYLERVKGMDIAALKAEICPVSIGIQIVKLGGNGRFPVDNKYKVVADKKRVVTITPIK